MKMESWDNVPAAMSREPVEGPHLNCSLNSLNGVLYKGALYGVVKRDTGSLDYSSFWQDGA